MISRLAFRAANPPGIPRRIRFGDLQVGLIGSRLPPAKQKSSKSGTDTVSPPVSKGTALRDEGCDVTFTGQVNQDE
jgi:hypothetical protein